MSSGFDLGTLGLTCWCASCSFHVQINQHVNRTGIEFKGNELQLHLRVHCWHVSSVAALSEVATLLTLPLPPNKFFRNYCITRISPPKHLCRDFCHKQIGVGEKKKKKKKEGSVQLRVAKVLRVSSVRSENVPVGCPSSGPGMRGQAEDAPSQVRRTLERSYLLGRTFIVSLLGKLDLGK
ncbi:hypothetical protein CEXT_695061 [Caerostris extrusa]|uniref:Uncharacterized protein n=1 Tax=Caerostris extrusa TaxID=172846 RepID=A0AAV4X6Q8_CAEEX|nr:hypothetical protein CEXT_695061 [Caerostris extrusa]